LPLMRLSLAPHAVTRYDNCMITKSTSSSSTRNDLADLAELSDSWAIHLAAAGLAPQTLRSYAMSVDRFLAWCTEHGRPAALHRDAVAGFLADLLASGLEPTTARTRYAGLRQFSAWLAEEGEISSDELVGMRPPKLRHKVVESLSDDDVKRMAKACAGREFRDVRDAAILRLMVETGLRAGEVVALSVGDIDVRTGVAIIRKAKNRRGRKVSFGPRTAAAVDRYLRQRRGHRLAGTSALWLGDRGVEFGYAGLRKALAARAKAAGITGFHPHKLRHTFASRWLGAGGSEGGAMAQGGWSQRAMMDRYAQDTSEARAAEESRRLGLGDF
jgi:integrase/recombinase XerD